MTDKFDLEKMSFIDSIDRSVRCLKLQRKRMLDHEEKIINYERDSSNERNELMFFYQCDADFYMVVLRRLYRRIEIIAKKDSRVANLKGKYRKLCKKVKIRDDYEHGEDRHVGKVEIPENAPNFIVTRGLIINKESQRICSSGMEWCLNEDHEKFIELVAQFTELYPFCTKISLEIVKKAIKDMEKNFWEVTMIIELFDQFMSSDVAKQFNDTQGGYGYNSIFILVYKSLVNDLICIFQDNYHGEKEGKIVKSVRKMQKHFDDQNIRAQLLEKSYVNVDGLEILNPPNKEYTDMVTQQYKEDMEIHFNKLSTDLKNAIEILESMHKTIIKKLNTLRNKAIAHHEMNYNGFAEITLADWADVKRFANEGERVINCLLAFFHRNVNPEFSRKECPHIAKEFWDIMRERAIASMGKEI